MANEYSEQRIRKIVREEVVDIRTELVRQGGLLEDVYDKLSALAELVADSLKVKKQVNQHEDHITSLQINQTLLTKTVKAHSRQLKQA